MTIEEKYARLLIHYCLELKEGENLYIQSSLLAEPLIREVYREGLKAGAHVAIDMSFRGKNKTFLNSASQKQLDYVSPISEYIINHFDAHLVIRAPFNLREDHNIDMERRKRRSLATKSLNEVFSRRTANGELARTLCQYPTDASAQEANMSLEEYRNFVFNACHLYDEDPSHSWKLIRKDQQKIVDYLNKTSFIRYKNKKTDICFSVVDRTWINSDGRVNMPSGEVFTSPVEESVNGTIYFDYPSIYMGQEVSGITLEVSDGKIIKWHAEKGTSVLDEIMTIEGAQYFGEVAIGTNYNIQIPTKNILFDEKIGGTIHMALGQSYIQTRGVNKSVVHWDLIADMTDEGQILADDNLIYENGLFKI